MAIKVIAQLREVKIGKNPGKKFVMRPDLYVPIAEVRCPQAAEGVDQRRLSQADDDTQGQGAYLYRDLRNG